MSRAWRIGGAWWGGLVLASLWLGGLEGASADQAVGPAAIWRAPADAIAHIHRECDAVAGGPAFGDCFIAVMQKTGASPDAVAFARRMADSAYLREFRKAGSVDVAYILYPFRANENSGCLLVNGEPAIVDVDDLQALPQEQLDADPVYQALRGRYRVTIWPADRTGRSGPDALGQPGGGQRFVVEYRLRDFCHACQVVGMAAFAFDFDAGGRLLGRRLLGVHAGEGPDGTTQEKEASSPPRLEVAVGQEFTVTLASNPTTGYRWQLVPLATRGVVQLTGTGYVAFVATRAGAGGTEVWKFRAVGPGTAEIVLRYARPWEGGGAPAETARYEVVVR